MDTECNTKPIEFHPHEKHEVWGANELWMPVWQGLGCSLLRFLSGWDCDKPSQEIRAYAFYDNVHLLLPKNEDICHITL